MSSDPSSDQTQFVDVRVSPDLAAITSRYDILAETGRGAMGIVYKARDRQTNDIVALKVLHPAIASQTGFIDRFKNELLLARRITHKNVCRVHDLNDLGNATVISMEFVEGENLRDVLARPGGLSIRNALKVARQMVSGLGEAHAQGVVHRDLKPANILISRDGTVKVMDFGIARSIDSHDSSPGLILGTPAYMSPEQAEGRQPDARSDIYSLGLVMYELFCGRPPFSAESASGFMTQHLHAAPPSPLTFEPDLPARIARAIQKCLEKDPAKRFQSTAELDAALAGESSTETRTAGADETPLPVHLARWQRSDWLLVTGAALGLLLFFSTFARSASRP